MGLDNLLAFAEVSDAVAREDRREAEGEGPSNTLEGHSSGEFFEGHYVSEARVAFFRACVGWVDPLGVGGCGVVVYVGGVGGVGSGGGGGSNGIGVGRVVDGVSAWVGAGKKVVAVTLCGVAEAFVLNGEVSIRNV